MSVYLETLNRGRVDEFGFWGPFVDEINLGELPPMPFSQFCEYGTEAMIEVLEKTDSQLKDKLVQRIKELWRDAQAIGTRRPADLLLFGFLHPEEGLTSRHYPTNPFSVSDEVVGIDELYIVSHKQFAEFVLYAFGGGLMGWNKKMGIPKLAYDSLSVLSQKIAT